ncbi:MAG TPA: von Willebrand factor type A domain-containing protein [Sedimentisphaerales bacterium]|nr:von Willebrand factor type A domain-containing protein [Sedimentisphaerales bacterium]
MKRKDNKLEQNISRLVKLTGDRDRPSKEFTDALTNDALADLAKSGKGRMGHRKVTPVKIKWLRILAYAAVIMVLCGVVISLTVPSLNKAMRMALAEIQPASGDTESALYSVPDKGDRSRAGPKPKVVSEAEKFSRYLSNPAPAEAASAPPACMIARTPAFTGTPPLEARGGAYQMAHGGTTPPNGEQVDAMFFKNYGVNPFVDTEDDNLSTFAVDVDTGSYTVVRQYLHDGHVPPEKAVRAEEFINYFKYDYEAPHEDVFAVYAEAAPWKFGTGRRNSHLLKLALKAREVSDRDRKPAILTFVIDVSGSMNRENRLGLVKKALRMLVENLKEHDRIGIAVYGSRGRKIMDHIGLDEKAEILAAIESLNAEGSTYAEDGIRIGYEMADSAYRKGYINRVILCSDGVANVGQTGADDILKVIKAKADKGVTLSTIGFGMGNYNDVLMETLGDKGNGHYAYVDTLVEAKRIFVENLTGTLQVVARDVKVQVEFNPEVVRSYRLIGYENRDVPDDKFRDDKQDGGEVGAGHSVTALYELKLWPDKTGTAATTYVRYKDADTDEVTEFKRSISTQDFADTVFKFVYDGFDSNVSFDFRLAAVAAEFAEILRKSYWAKGAKLSDTLTRAQSLLHQRPGDADVIELVDLISKANQLIKDTNVETGQVEDEYLEP